MRVVLFQLWRWTQETIHRVFISHKTTGTTISSVADFEDLHKHLERQMTAHEQELSSLRSLILSLPVSTDRENFQVVYICTYYIISSWTK